MMLFVTGMVLIGKTLLESSVAIKGLINTVIDFELDFSRVRNSYKKLFVKAYFYSNKNSTRT